MSAEWSITKRLKKERNWTKFDAIILSEGVANPKAKKKKKKILASSEHNQLIYLVYSLGEYDVNILFDDKHIPGSPFKVGATFPVDASKVKCKGKGVGRNVPASYPAEFTVDATKAGKAPLEVDVVGPGDKKYPCNIVDNNDGTFDCAYVPEKKGELFSHQANICGYLRST